MGNDSWKAVGPIASILAVLLITAARRNRSSYWTMTGAFAATVLTMLGPLLPELLDAWQHDPPIAFAAFAAACALSFAGLALLVTVKGWIGWALLLVPLLVLPATRLEVGRLLGGSLLVGAVVFAGWRLLAHRFGWEDDAEDSGIQPTPEFHNATEDWYSEILQQDLEIEF